MKNMTFLADNFETESKIIAYGLAPEMSINDLTESEKAEMFGDNSMELDFSMADAFEMTR
jgi:hypothetical protein